MQKAHRPTPLTRGAGRLRKPSFWGFYLVCLCLCLCLSEIIRPEDFCPRPRWNWKPATPLSGEAAGSFHFKFELGEFLLCFFFWYPPGSNRRPREIENVTSSMSCSSPAGLARPLLRGISLFVREVVNIAGRAGPSWERETGVLNPTWKAQLPTAQAAPGRVNLDDLTAGETGKEEKRRKEKKNNRVVGGRHRCCICILYSVVLASH